jgi:DNA-binding IclR family transcriptional regulator
MVTGTDTLTAIGTASGGSLRDPAPTSTMPVAPPPSMIERITLIMDLFDGPGDVMALEEVSRRTGLPRSSAHRILEQLTMLEWVRRSASGYRLGARAKGLGAMAGGDNAVRAAAAPLLHELAFTTGLVAQLAVLDGSDVIFVDKVRDRSAVDVPWQVGDRAPADRTASGKSLLAWLDAEQVDARFHDRIEGASLTASDLRLLHQDLDRVRTRHGLAFERDGWSAGIAAVAVGIRGPEGNPIGALSLAGDLDAPLERIAPMMVRAARRVRHSYLRPEQVVGRGDRLATPTVRMRRTA